MEKKIKPRILAVEDVPTIQKLLSLYFTQMGCPFDIAENGARALELIELHSYDFIVMDLGLPDTDGLTITETIRRKKQYQKTPIIAFTAHDDEKIRQACFDNGITEFVRKPIDRSGMHAIIKKYCPEVD